MSLGQMKLTVFKQKIWILQESGGVSMPVFWLLTVLILIFRCFRVLIFDAYLQKEEKEGPCIVDAF